MAGVGFAELIGSPKADVPQLRERLAGMRERTNALRVTRHGFRADWADDEIVDDSQTTVVDESIDEKDSAAEEDVSEGTTAAEGLAASSTPKAGDDLDNTALVQEPDPQEKPSKKRRVSHVRKDVRMTVAQFKVLEDEIDEWKELYWKLCDHAEALVSRIEHLQQENQDLRCDKKLYRFMDMMLQSRMRAINRPELLQRNL